MGIQTWKRTRIPERTELAEEWKQKGFSCGLWVDPPEQRWLDFVHETDELVLVLRGKIRLEVESDSAELAEGEEALIPSGMRHSVHNIGGTEARWYFGYAKEKPKVG